MPTIGDIIDIVFRGDTFKGVVINMLANNEYEVIYESLDMPNFGRYIKNQVYLSTSGWTLVNPSAKIAGRKIYKDFIEKLKWSLYKNFY